MLPYIQIGKIVLESYTLFNNLGTLIGLFVMYLLMDKYCKDEKFWWKLIGIVFVIMIISAPFAKLVKGLFRQGNWSATHFLGRVLMAFVLLELVFRFMWKDKETMLQAGNATVMYIVIQHFFNRISCYLNGCCSGIYIEKLGITWPSQLFEASCMLVLGIILACHIKAGKSFYYETYICYSCIIFISEFLIKEPRIDIVKTFIFTGVQLGAIVLCILAVVFLILKKKKYEIGFLKAVGK